MLNVSHKNLVPVFATASFLLSACGGAPAAAPALPGQNCPATAAITYYSANAPAIGANGCVVASGTVPTGPTALHGQWVSPEVGDPSPTNQGGFTYHYVMNIVAKATPPYIQIQKVWKIGTNQPFNAPPTTVTSQQIGINTITGDTVTLSSSAEIKSNGVMSNQYSATAPGGYLSFKEPSLITPSSFTYSLVSATDPTRMNINFTLPAGPQGVQIFTKSQ